MEKRGSKYKTGIGARAAAGSMESAFAGGDSGAPNVTLSPDARAMNATRLHGEIENLGLRVLDQLNRDPYNRQVALEISKIGLQAAIQSGDSGMATLFASILTGAPQPSKLTASGARQASRLRELRSEVPAIPEIYNLLMGAGAIPDAQPSIPTRVGQGANMAFNWGADAGEAIKDFFGGGQGEDGEQGHGVPGGRSLPNPGGVPGGFPGVPGMPGGGGRRAGMPGGGENPAQQLMVNQAQAQEQPYGADAMPLEAVGGEVPQGMPGGGQEVQQMTATDTTPQRVAAPRAVPGQISPQEYARRLMQQAAAQQQGRGGGGGGEPGGGGGEGKQQGRSKWKTTKDIANGAGLALGAVFFGSLRVVEPFAYLAQEGIKAGYRSAKDSAQRRAAGAAARAWQRQQEERQSGEHGDTHEDNGQGQPNEPDTGPGGTGTGAGTADGGSVPASPPEGETGSAQAPSTEPPPPATGLDAIPYEDRTIDDMLMEAEFVRGALEHYAATGNGDIADLRRRHEQLNNDRMRFYENGVPVDKRQGLEAALEDLSRYVVQAPIMGAGNGSAGDASGSPAGTPFSSGGETGVPGTGSGAANDEYFTQALNLFANGENISVSRMQRELKIGYGRASRLADQIQAYRDEQSIPVSSRVIPDVEPQNTEKTEGPAASSGGVGDRPNASSQPLQGESLDRKVEEFADSRGGNISVDDIMDHFGVGRTFANVAARNLEEKTGATVRDSDRPMPTSGILDPEWLQAKNWIDEQGGPGNVTFEQFQREFRVTEGRARNIAEQLKQRTGMTFVDGDANNDAAASQPQDPLTDVVDGLASTLTGQTEQEAPIFASNGDATGGTAPVFGQEGSTDGTPAGQKQPAADEPKKKENEEK